MAKKNLPITLIVPVLNEAVNITGCLSSVTFAQRVIVVDSGSNDGTVELAKQAGAEVVQFDYQGGYPKKRQWVLDTQNIDTPWVMLLDADESVTPELEAEITRAIEDPNFDAYLISKGFHFMGRKFRFGGFSHSAVLLFKRGIARFEHLIDESSAAMDMEVHERLLVEGRVGRLNPPLIHEDYKGLEAYIDRHNKYSTWESKVRLQYMSHKESESETAIKANLFGDVQERRRFLKLLAMKIPGEHLLWFCYHYFFRLGFLEGRRGLIASQIRCNYIRSVRAKMYEQRLLDSGRAGRSDDHTV